MTREDAIFLLTEEPYRFGQMLGFTKLQPIHNGWIRDIVLGTEDDTLQGHRGSYKTTCLSIGLAIVCILFPHERTLFMRKTDSDVSEIIHQTQNILKNPRTKYICQSIYGMDLNLTKETSTEICTNLCNDIRGTSQIVGMGIKSSITGQHYDRIYTDDIVNVKDRKSRAEREQTKLAYQELQNIITRPGKIFNTGTPWHSDDAFSIMPTPRKFDCYSTGLMTEEEIKAKMEGMTSSLFAANYELRHIAEDDILFTHPQTGGNPDMIRDGISHIDAAYGGEDGTAFTMGRKVGGKYYILGKIYHRHVDDVEDDIIKIHREHNGGRMHCENNGDKGYLAKQLKRKGVRVHAYHEDTNKYIKISSYLKVAWKDVIFVDGTDEEYINQVCDYNENAEHDDCPDSLSCIIRILWGQKERTESDYIPSTY